MRAFDIAATAPILWPGAGTGRRTDHCNHGCGDWDRGYYRSPTLPKSDPAVV